jgi:hypothetical protein
MIGSIIITCRVEQNQIVDIVLNSGRKIVIIMLSCNDKLSWFNIS